MKGKTRVHTAALISVALILTAIIFIIDINVPLGIAIGALYSLVIVYCWLIRIHWFPIAMAVICSLLIVIGYNLSENLDQGNHISAINRLISLIVIWLCVAMVTLANQSFSSLNKAKITLEQKVSNRTDALRKKVIEINQQRELLLENSAKFRGLLESSPDAMVIVNRKGLIEIINEQVSSVFGYKPKDVIGKPVSKLMPERYSGAFENLQNEYFSNPESWGLGTRFELLASRSSGEEFPAEISFKTFKTSSDFLVIGSIRDISQRKINEKKIQTAKQTEIKNQELEQFVYAASHDLQEPLNTISNMAEMIEEDLANSAEFSKTRSYLNYLTTASNRLSILIKDLLKYSRLGTNREKEMVDLNVVLKEIEDDLMIKINETGAKLFYDKIPEVIGYRTELRLLFQNLISNALKFHRLEVPPIIRISFDKKWDKWIFKVQDNGVGIEKEHLQKIFVIFQRLDNATSIEGTGIGLAHCKKIVELHGGRISVSSTPGSGSIFSFSLARQI